MRAALGKAAPTPALELGVELFETLPRQSGPLIDGLIRRVLEWHERKLCSDRGMFGTGVRGARGGHELVERATSSTHDGLCSEGVQLIRWLGPRSVLTAPCSPSSAVPCGQGSRQVGMESVFPVGLSVFPAGS